MPPPPLPAPAVAETVFLHFRCKRRREKNPNDFAGESSPHSSADCWARQAARISLTLTLSFSHSPTVVTLIVSLCSLTHSHCRTLFTHPLSLSHSVHSPAVLTLTPSHSPTLIVSLCQSPTVLTLSQSHSLLPALCLMAGQDQNHPCRWWVLLLVCLCFLPAHIHQHMHASSLQPSSRACK